MNPAERDLQTDPSAAYARLGWPVTKTGGRLELITGTALDALEVPHGAGMLAARWWRHTGGFVDVVRQLPSLPDPGEALAVIASGDRWFFLAEAGSCPWRANDRTVFTAQGGPVAPEWAPGGVIRWHSHGARIPAPDARTEPGGMNALDAGWAVVPSRRIRLPCPVALLGLLARAAEATRLGPPALTLPGGAMTVPVLGS